MLTVEPITHIRRDERGVAWIDETNTKVIELVMDWMANASSPQELQRQHPHLSLAQIYSALAYYHDHQTDIDAQVARSLSFADQMRAEAVNQPTRAELMARLSRS
jgi:uncharacterized protein (DUF433 family)